MTEVCKLNAIEELGEAVEFDEFMKAVQEEALIRADGDEVRAGSMIPDLMREMAEENALASKRKIKQIAYSSQRRETLMAQLSHWANTMGQSARKSLDEVLAGVFNKAHYEQMEALKSYEKELRAGGYHRALKDKKRQLNVAKEIAELNKSRGGKPGMTGDKDAIEIARIHEKYIQSMRGKMARVGVPIANLEGRIIRQSFDSQYLIGVARDDFVKDMFGRVDRYRTFGGRKDVSDGEVIKYLGSYYDDVVNGTIRDVPITEFSLDYMSKTYSRRQADHRYLHLSKAEDILHVVDKYTGDEFPKLLYSAVGDLHYNGTVLLEMGVNPKNTFDALKEGAKRFAKTPKESQSLKNAGNVMFTHGIKDFYTNGKFNPDIATATNAVNNLTRAAFLQLSGISATGDLGTSMGAAARMGTSGLVQLGRSLNSIFIHFQDIDPELKKAMTAGAEANSSLMSAHLIEIGNGGSRLQQFAKGSQKLSDATLFFSGLRGLTNRMKEGAVFHFKTELFNLRGKGFGDLTKATQFTLSRAGISSKEWDVIRAGSDILKEDFGANSFFNVYKMDDLPDSAVKPLARTGATKQELSSIKDDLRRKMLAAFATYSDDAVITAGAKERAFISLGADEGTPSSFFTKTMMNLMGYPISYIYRAMGRINESSSGAQMASSYGYLLAASLVFGTMSDFLWNSAKGRKRDYEEIARDPMGGEAIDFFSSAIVRGGFGGLYTSAFLDYARYGGGTADYAAGAPFSLADDILGTARSMAMNAAEGDFESVMGSAIEKTKMIPLTQTPILGTAFDYMIYNPLMDMLAPDKLRRVENAWARRTGGEYFIGKDNHLFSE